ncbi:Uncharacterised protein [uncultured archaeon]|nr:Uncharacterised protein [uncultured archaeon]
MVSIADCPRVLYFGEKGIDAVRHVKFDGILLFALAVLMQAFPSNYSDMTDYTIKYLTNAGIVAVSLAVMISIVYGAMRVVGSKVRFRQYFGHLSAVMFLISFSSIAIAFLLINFGMVIGYPDVAFKLVQGSFIVYYMFVVFAWSSERLAGIDEPKGAFGGLVSLALVYVFHLMLNLLP